MTDPAPLDAVPEIPGALRAWMGERVDAVAAFTDALCTRGVERGLIGPREVPRVWERHIGNCAVVAELLPEGATVVDVGSGGGLPGLVLALVRPDLSITLLEPMLRRTTWLTEMATELGLSQVTVVRGRAGEIDLPLADVVTSRAVARLDQLAPWCVPLAKPQGAVLALKGAGAQAEIDDARSTLSRLGVLDTEILTCGDGLLETPTTVVRLVVGSVGQRRARSRPRRH